MSMHARPPFRRTLATVLVSAGSAHAIADAPPTPASVPATTPEAGAASTPTPAPSSDLMLFEDIPMVVTAGRTAQAQNLSATPVSIVTSEDIHYSGFTNIADVLRFVPGVDVVRTDRNRVGVNVRGMGGYFTERSLTLLNGQETETPYRGSPDLMSLPVFMEDIDRIEVVRGPGGASWGSNALNGVINIITKDPEKTQGVLLTSRVSQFGDVYSQFRWGATNENLSWRISGGYIDSKSSDDAINHDDFVSNDFNREWRFDTTFAYKLSAADKLTFGISGSFAERHDSVWLGLGERGDEQLDGGRAYLKLDHTFDDGGSLYVQWFGRYDDRNQPNVSAHPVSFINNLDMQMTLAKMSNHTISFGGNIRFLNMDLKGDFPESAFFPGGSDLTEINAGLFVQDRYDFAKNWWLEGQARFDYQSDAEDDWSGRLAVLHALDERQEHILRFAVARAFRTLPIEYREASAVSFLTLSSPPRELDNEGTWAFEAGYTGKLTDHLTLRLDGYVQRYDNLIGLYVVNFAPVTLSAQNRLGGTAYGVETELAYKAQWGELSAWYAYNYFGSSEDKEAGNIRGYTPSTHKVGLSGRWFIDEDWTFNANYRYSGLMDYLADADSVATLHPSHRLDLAITRSFADGAAELMVGVEDVFNKTEKTSQELGVGAFAVPGRTFFARIQVKF